MKLGECYQIGMCSLTCPKGLNPRGALGHLKELYADYDSKKKEDSITIWLDFYCGPDQAIKIVYTLIVKLIFKVQCFTFRFKTALSSF